MKNTTENKLIIVTGPTATGKTRFAAELASKINGEIISADSRQVYRSMDLGTGKDYEDYRVGNTDIPYHLIDMHDPGYKYNVFEYQHDFFNAFQDIQQRGKQAILCGGTGMYIEAVTKNYKLISVPVNAPLRATLKEKSLKDLVKMLAAYKKLHNKSDSDTKKRAIRAIEIEEYYQTHTVEEKELPALKPIFFGVQVDRDIRRARITKRLEKRLEEGMIEEVKAMLEKGVPPEDLIYYGLEYKYITLHLTGQLSFDEMKQQLNTAIHQFAKRQMTWFRRMERNGTNIHWINGMATMEEKLEQALRILADN